MLLTPPRGCGLSSGSGKSVPGVGERSKSRAMRRIVGGLDSSGVGDRDGPGCVYASPVERKKLVDDVPYAAAPQNHTAAPQNRVLQSTAAGRAVPGDVTLRGTNGNG